MKLRTLLILALSLLTLLSCSEDSMLQPAQDEAFALVFSSENTVITKAGTDGTMVGTTNENLLKSIDYFIYAEGKTDEPALFHGTYDVPTPAALATVRISFNADFVATLFPTGAKTCEIFAVANHKVPTGATNPTLDELLNTPVSSDFLNPADPESFIMVSTDEETGEIGSTTVKLISRETTTTAIGYVAMRRLASKISIQLHVEKDAVIFNEISTGDGLVRRTEIWRPLLDEIQIYMLHGVDSAQLSGAPFDNSGDLSDELFDYGYNSRSLTNESETRTYLSYGYERDANGYIVLSDGEPVQLDGAVERSGDFRLAEPFYSYPQFWEYGYTYEPYIKLVIPWERQPGTNPDGTSYGNTSKPYYYKVICHGSPYSDNEATLKSNNWYKLFLNIGILGSEIDEGEAVVDGTFIVVDWQEKENTGTGEDPDGSGSTDTDKETEIVGARYLSVPHDVYEIHNMEDLAFPITTSHECEITNLKAVMFDYIEMEESDITSGYTINIENGHLVFYNDLKNYKEEGVGSDYNVATCTFTFTIKHTDSDDYSRDITIMQYPSIMITSHTNSDGTANDNDGYVFVNNGIGSYGGVHGLTGTNKNENMYIIQTTVLTPESGFVIGDPRVNTIDNLGGTWSANAIDINGETRRLTYYYPVDKSGDADNIIAPKFRNASSYGVTNDVSYEDAFRRCASYQEDGYPAGRWRVPTVAEIQYMAQLTADGKIPRLFTASSSYWCNSGSVHMPAANATDPTPTHSTVTTGENPVRCVYDEWYWEVVDELAGRTIPLEGAAKEQFTWGDEPRN